MALDPQIHAVVAELDRLGGSFVAGSTAEEARRRPNAADAVRSLLWAEGTSLAPEPVGAVEDLEIPTPSGPVPIRVYWPLGADPGPLPVLVYAHGGTWVTGDADAYDATPRAIANRAGCIVVSVDYRRAPEHPFPAAHDDVRAATRWVATNISQLSGDPARLALGGEGPGATLAMAASLAFGRQAGAVTRPVFQLLLYPVGDLVRSDWTSFRTYDKALPLGAEMHEWAIELVASPRDREDPRLSPARATRSELGGLPSTLIITAEYDPIRDQGEALGRTLLDAGVDATTLRFAGVTHDFVGMNPVAGVAQAAVALAAKHLRAAFGQRGEAAPTVAPDLAQVIEADDAGILALRAQLAAGGGDRTTLVDQLRDALVARHEMEEAAPAGALTLGDLGALLAPLDDEATDSPRFHAALDALGAAVDDLRLTQEGELAGLRADVGNDRMREMGVRALETRKAAPGRARRELAHAG